MSYGGISVKFMSNVLIVNRSWLEMPKQKQFHGLTYITYDTKVEKCHFLTCTLEQWY
jgi:hypothetical protein